MTWITPCCPCRIIAQDGTAIATVTALVTGNTNINGTTASQNVTFPSIGKQQISAYRPGRVSVPLEYEVASSLPLSSGTSHIGGITLDVSVVKTKTRTTLSGLLNTASQALKQLPIPANPYSQVGSKILDFANSSVDSVIQQNGPYETAHLGLAFADHKIENIAQCKAAGKERTGAIVVLFRTGDASPNQSLLPVTNIDAEYCLSYSSENTYEATYAPRNTDGSCPKQGYHSVPNDYLMFLLSADSVTAESSNTVSENNARVAAAVDKELSNSKTTSGAGVPKGGAGGIERASELSGSVVDNLKKEYGQDPQVESIVRCKERQLPLSACGVQEK